MKYIIRRATKNDLPKIIELAADMSIMSSSPFRSVDIETVKKYRRSDLSSLYQTLQNPCMGVFVAEDLNGEFMGHVIAMNSYIESSTGELQGYIFDLSIIKDYQNLGIGKNLMATAEEFCASEGMKYVCLNVTSSNENAVKFYEKIGYAEERKRMIKVITPKKQENSKDTGSEADEKKG